MKVGDILCDKSNEYGEGVIASFINAHLAAPVQLIQIESDVITDYGAQISQTKPLSMDELAQFKSGCVF